MAYIPPNQNYLPYDWSGVVTANDIAIQNQPWSLGQHLGPTREQQAQKEIEDWFRAQGLDPNRFTPPVPSAALAPAPQGFYRTPDGALIRGKAPRGFGEKYTTEEVDKMLADDAASVAKEDKRVDAQGFNYYLNHQKEYQNRNFFNRDGTRDVAPTKLSGESAGDFRQRQRDWFSGARTVSGAVTPTPSYSPVANNGAPPIFPSSPASPTKSAAPDTFLPPYLQPGTGAAGAPGSIPPPGQATTPIAVAPLSTAPGSPLTPLPQGFATPRPVTPGLAPAMTGQPRTGGGSFGATAKLLELPWYLRQQAKAY